MTGELHNGRGARSLPVSLLVAAAAASGALYLVLALGPDLARRPWLYLSAHGALLALGLLALAAARRLASRRRALLVALVAAGLFRAVLLIPGVPLLSPDLYRYLWDGRISLSGLNPYARAPADPLFDEDAPAWRDRINHPELPTIYPPVAQAAFRGVASLGGGPRAWKALAAGADLLVLLLLVRWPGPRSRPLATAFLYGWNPLVVVESAGSGHVDILGVALLVLGARWVTARRELAATIAWTGSFLVKPVTLVALPALARRTGWVRTVALAGAASALLYWPYRRLGAGAMGSLGTYLESWSFNSPVYEALRGVLEVGRVEGALRWLIDALGSPLGDPPWRGALYSWVHPEAAARFLLALALGAAVVLVWRRRLHLSRELLLVLAAALLLAPTLHPWYLLWVLPWAVLERSGPMLLLSALLPLSYLAAAQGGPASAWLMAVEFLPPALWALSGLRRLRGQGPSSRASIRASGG